MSKARRLAALAAPFAALLALPLDGARAQGFFQGLFGFGDPPPRAAPSRPVTLPPASGQYRAPVILPQRSAPGDAGPDGARHEDVSGRYRTLCVRMCDGYYFPISAAVSRRAFHRDAAQCHASCGTEARLFYHSSASGDASTMIDLAGRAYARLPNAFKYRKSMVDGCKCKPEPWAQSELDRHHRYAAAQAVAATSVVVEGKEVPKPAGPAASVIAGGADRGKPAAAGAGTSDETKAEASASEVGTATPSEPAGNAAAPPSRATPGKLAAASRRDGSAARAARAAPPPPRQPVETGQGPAGRTKAPAAAVVVARAPQKKAPPGMVGLGGQKLRWPGD